MTEFTWHSDANRDPFHKYLNLGDPEQLPPY